MSLRWDDATERLLCGETLTVLRFANRTRADVLRAMREGRVLVVLLPQRQEPVDSLLQLRSLLDDDELSVVARVLGF